MSETSMRVKCPNPDCEASLKVLSSTAQRFRCPKCGKVVQKDSPRPTAATPGAVKKTKKTATQNAPETESGAAEINDVETLIKKATRRWKAAEEERATPLPIQTEILDDPDGFLIRIVAHTHGVHKECVNPACSSPSGKWRKRGDDSVDIQARIIGGSGLRDKLFDDGDEESESHENRFLILFPEGIEVRGKRYSFDEYCFCKECFRDLYTQAIERKNRIDKLLTKICKKLCEAIEQGEQNPRLQKTLTRIQITLKEERLPVSKPKGKWWEFWKW